MKFSFLLPKCIFAIGVGTMGFAFGIQNLGFLIAGGVMVIASAAVELYVLSSKDDSLEALENRVKVAMDEREKVIRSMIKQIDDKTVSVGRVVDILQKTPDRSPFGG